MMEWIKVTPETMPPDMEQIMITVRFWNGNKAVWNGKARFNKLMNVFEVWMSDGYASGWARGEIYGDVTHWALWPKPAED